MKQGNRAATLVSHYRLAGLDLRLSGPIRVDLRLRTLKMAGSRGMQPPLQEDEVPTRLNSYDPLLPYNRQMSVTDVYESQHRVLINRYTFFPRRYILTANETR